MSCDGWGRPRDAGGRPRRLPAPHFPGEGNDAAERATNAIKIIHQRDKRIHSVVVRQRPPEEKPQEREEHHQVGRAPEAAEAPVQGGESFFHARLTFSSSSTVSGVSSVWARRCLPFGGSRAIDTFCDVSAQLMTRRGLRGSSGSRKARESTAK